MDAVYGELRQMARGYLRRERASHSLPPTALVHEAYLKLVDQRRVQWQNRAHFFAIAARVMRRILVDHARGTRIRKTGQRRTVDAAGHGRQPSSRPTSTSWLSTPHSRSSPRSIQRQCRLVELRFFGGLTVEEAAAALDSRRSRSSATGRWRGRGCIAKYGGPAAMKTPADWERVRELFHRALALPPEERTAFVSPRDERGRGQPSGGRVAAGGACRRRRDF